MNTSRGVLILALATVLWGVAAPARAQGGDKALNFSAAGALQPSSYVFPDGHPAVYVTDVGKSTFGPITVYEWIAAVADGQTCTLASGAPNAGSERRVEDALYLIRFESTGDLVFGNLVSGTQCVDLSSGTPPFPFQGDIEVSVTGGTGKFAGASGTFTESSSGQFLSCTQPQGPCVGYGLKMVTGTVTYPQGPVR